MNNNTIIKNKFQKIIQECIQEVKSENNPRAQLKESLRGVVKNVLREFVNTGKPEADKEEKEKESKQYNKKGNERLDKTNEKLMNELETLVHGIDPTFQVYFDDYNALIVRAHNLLYVRIVQRFENDFMVDAYTKLVDRVRSIGLNWQQVKDMIKTNFSDIKSTRADDLHKKALDNYKNKEVSGYDLPKRSEVIKNRGEKNNGEDAKIKSTKKDDKDYNTPQTERDEDLPDKPMKQVTEPGKDPKSLNKNFKKTPQVKPTKWKNDKKLRIPDKKTKKFTEKQLKVS